jgi:hypothetical protein
MNEEDALLYCGRLLWLQPAPFLDHHSVRWPDKDDYKINEAPSSALEGLKLTMQSMVYGCNVKLVLPPSFMEQYQQMQQHYEVLHEDLPNKAGYHHGIHWTDTKWNPCNDSARGNNDHGPGRVKLFTHLSREFGVITYQMQSIDSAAATATKLATSSLSSSSSISNTVVGYQTTIASISVNVEPIRVQPLSLSFRDLLISPSSQLQWIGGRHIFLFDFHELELPTVTLYDAFTADVIMEWINVLTILPCDERPLDVNDNHTNYDDRFIIVISVSPDTDAIFSDAYLYSLSSLLQAPTAPENVHSQSLDTTACLSTIPAPPPSSSITSMKSVVKWTYRHGSIEWLNYDMIMIHDITLNNGSTLTIYNVPSWSDTSSTMVGTLSRLHQFKSSYDTEHADGWRLLSVIPSRASRYTNDRYTAVIEWVTITLMNHPQDAFSSLEASSNGRWSLDLIAIVLSYLI